MLRPAGALVCLLPLVATARAQPLSPVERAEICEAHIRDGKKGVCLQLIALDRETPVERRREQQSCVLAASDPESCLTAAARRTLAQMIGQRRTDCAAFPDDALLCLQRRRDGCEKILDELPLWREPIPTAPTGPAVVRTFTIPTVDDIHRDGRRFELLSDGTLVIVDARTRTAFRKGKRVTGGSGTSLRFTMPDIKVGEMQLPIAAPNAVVYNDDEGIIRTTNLIRTDGRRWKVKTGCAGLPAADEKLVYTLSFGIDERGPLTVLALDQRDGAIVWQRELENSVPTLKWRDDVRMVAGPGRLVAIVKDRVYELR